MRTQMFGLSFALSTLVACGGGGGSKTPDSKLFLDAPIDQMATCAVMTSLGGLNLVSTMPSDYIDTDRGGSLAGRTVLSVGGRLPSSTAALLDVLVVDYVKPMAGGFQLNTAINFDPNPAAAPFVAASYVFGDLDPNVTPNTVQNFYYASNGSITVTAVGETSGAAIKGSVASTSYREVDDNNADVPSGCATALTALNFDVVHNGMNFAPPTGNNADGLQPLSREEWAAVNRIRATRGM
jgi:hypothetical protein